MSSEADFVFDLFFFPISFHFGSILQYSTKWHVFSPDTFLPTLSLEKQLLCIFINCFIIIKEVAICKG